MRAILLMRLLMLLRVDILVIIFIAWMMVLTGPAR